MLFLQHVFPFFEPFNINTILLLYSFFISSHIILFIPLQSFNFIPCSTLTLAIIFTISIYSRFPYSSTIHLVFSFFFIVLLFRFFFSLSFYLPYINLLYFYTAKLSCIHLLNLLFIGIKTPLMN